MPAASATESSVVVTGLGVLSAAGVGWESLMDAVQSRERQIHIRDGFPVATIDPFDAKQFVRPRKALKVMGREVQTAFAASMLAIEQSRLVVRGNDPVWGADSDGSGTTDPGSSSDADSPILFDPDRVATVFGSEMLYDPSDLAIAVQMSLEGDRANMPQFGEIAMKRITPLWLLKYLPNMPACHVGISIGARGPNNTLVTGDTSGMSAMAEAMSCIGRDAVDVAVVAAAGTRTNETRMTYTCDVPRVPKLAADADCNAWGNLGLPGDPKSTCVIGGEAAVAIVVESQTSAERRGIPVLCKILGMAQRFVPAPVMSDATRDASLAPASIRGSAEAMVAATRAVLSQTQTDASSIGLIVSHMSGDPILDGLESKALSSFGFDASVLSPIHSVGHTGAASGAIELGTAIAAIVRGQNPPERPVVLVLNHTPEGAAVAALLR